MLYSIFAVALLIPATALLVLGLLSLFLERKLIGIAQKRLGISFLGRNGWAHLPADLVKFWLKYSARHHANWLSTATGVVGAIFAYLAWSLLSTLFFPADGGSTPIDFWDYQLLVYFAYANLSTLLMFCVVAGTKSKYATIASARILLVSVYMEVFFVLIFLCLYAHTGGFSFEEISLASRTHTFALSLPPLALFLCLYTLFEAKRAPFDHSEAESELVAGHMVEFGGRALLFFYMCEYTHVVFCLFLIVSLCFGIAFPAVAPSAYLYIFELGVAGAFC